MASMTLSDVLTMIYVLVDDWYQVHGAQLLKGKVGHKPVFSDTRSGC